MLSHRYLLVDGQPVVRYFLGQGESKDFPLPIRTLVANIIDALRVLEDLSIKPEQLEAYVRETRAKP